MMTDSTSEVEFPSIAEDYLETSIGLTGRHGRLVCGIHLHDKTTSFFKMRNGLIDCLLCLEEKTKKEAFNLIASLSKTEKAQNFETFLPGELLRGNSKIIPEFLRRLKQQRAESYIKLRWKERMSSSRSVFPLTNILSKILLSKKKSAFHLLFSVNLTRGIDSYYETSFEIKGGKISENTHAELIATPERSFSRGLNLTYTRVSTTSYRGGEGRRREPKIIDVRDLQKSREKVTYRYSSQDSKWHRMLKHRS